MKIQENVALAPLTTLQVGGAARYFAELKREDEVREAVEYAKTRDLPLLVLGRGSNLVVADSGWPGLALKIAIGGIASPSSTGAGAKEAASNAVLFSVGAGVDWDDLVAQAVAQNCAGIECLSGIPGSAGATPVQNVGAYGQEAGDTIESVRALDWKADRIVVLPKPACGFRYRSSIFNGSERGRYIILRVNYRLKRGGAPNLKYADLQKHFAGRFCEGAAGKKTPVSLAETREAVLAIRRSKGMLMVPGDDDCRSAGSFFKNPVVGEAQFEELAARAAAQALEIPSYPAHDLQSAAQDLDAPTKVPTKAQRKISAAWLVEHSGFSKGYALGPARISSKHALALVNSGQASAADMVRLQERIQDKVRESWGIRLDPEPVFVGF
jgi:UDP-N-acetylmuramate dehydrogenase